MAETISPRFSFTRWGAGTDTPSREEFDNNFGQAEDLGAIDRQNTFANRPSPGVRGTYFYDTTNGILWRDTGIAWVVIGSVTRDAVAASSGTSTVPLSAVGQSAGQTGNLFEARTGNTVRASISPTGSFTGDVLNGTRLSVLNTAANQNVVYGRGAASQSSSLLRLDNSLSLSQFQVSPMGAITSTYLSTDSGRGVIGTNTLSNVQGMNLFGGTPVFETFAAGSGTYSDFVYLRHAAAAATAGLRRFGLMIKIGNEVVGDASKSGAVYIESNAANAANPTLVLASRDQPVLSFPFGQNPVFHNAGLTLQGGLTVPGDVASLTSGIVNNVGTHNDGSLYLRSNGAVPIYFYGGGAHNSVPGNPGTGGGTRAVLDHNYLTTPRLRLTSTTDASLGSTLHALQIGDDGGPNIRIDNNEIMAVNGGSDAPLAINLDGGTVTFNGGTSSGGSNVSVDVFQDVRGRSRIWTGGSRQNFNSSSSSNTGCVMTDNDGFQVARATDSTTSPVMHVNKIGSNGEMITFRRAGQQVAAITATTTTVSYNTSSDYRLKEDVRPVADPLFVLRNLRPVKFKWSSTGESAIGFLAHEVKEVLPSVVFGDKDGVSEDGSPIYQSIDHSKIVPLLVAAVQDLSVMVESLKEELGRK